MICAWPRVDAAAASLSHGVGAEKREQHQENRKHPHRGGERLVGDVPPDLNGLSIEGRVLRASPPLHEPLLSTGPIEAVESGHRLPASICWNHEKQAEWKHLPPGPARRTSPLCETTHAATAAGFAVREPPDLPRDLQSPYIGNGHARRKYVEVAATSD